MVQRRLPFRIQICVLLSTGSLSKASGAPITQAEMATLTRLDAPNKNIRDLTGLEFAINLTAVGP